MIAEKPTERQLRFIVQNLRDVDRRELLATGCVLDELPARIMRSNVFAFVASDDFMMPHAAWGLMQQRKGVGTGFAFGTKHWGRALPTMVRNMRNWVLPFLLREGYHRVECAALAHRTDVKRFLALIGAQPEAVLRQWGVEGEDFISYRWLADEYRAASQTDRHVSH